MVPRIADQASGHSGFCGEETVEKGGPTTCGSPEPAIHGEVSALRRAGRIQNRDRDVPTALSGPHEEFFLYDGTCLADGGGIFAADLAISPDVVYY